MIYQVSKSWRDINGTSSDKSLLKKESNTFGKTSIQSKLTKLYFEELLKVPHATPDSVLVKTIYSRSKNKKTTPNFQFYSQNYLENECDLLGRLVQRERLHTLIVNLYAGNKGYSLGVRNR